MNTELVTKCLHPLKITNRYTHEPLLVSCGKCEACLLQKSAMRSLKCQLESLSHSYTYFITLTYDNQCVPLMRPDFANNLQSAVCDKEYVFIDMCNRSATYGCNIAEGRYSLSELDILLRKTSLNGCIPYLNRRDAQLFIKRLRKHINKISNEKIRYYIVGEYGPVHYRPHFHLLLWFSDKQIASNLSNLIHKSWKFGRFDSQVSVGKSASYVAGYLNGTCYLPSILKQSFTSPFAFHSQFLGEKILRREKEEVYKMQPEQFIKGCLRINDVSSEFTLWRSLKNFYFPRCPQYSLLNHRERYASYCSYEATSEVCTEISPYKQAYEIVSNIVYNPDACSIPIIDYFAKKYHIQYLFSSPMIFENTRQVYEDLRISKHFLEFVCDSTHFTERDSKLLMVEAFYNRLDYLSLCDQIEYVDNYILDGFDYDDLSFIYWNKWFDQSKYKNIKLYRMYHEKVLDKYSKSIKHKTLNDKNKIFERL